MKWVSVSTPDDPSYQTPVKNQYKSHLLIHYSPNCQTRSEKIQQDFERWSLNHEPMLVWWQLPLMCGYIPLQIAISNNFEKLDRMDIWRWLFICFFLLDLKTVITFISFHRFENILVLRERLKIIVRGSTKAPLQKIVCRQLQSSICFLTF